MKNFRMQHLRRILIASCCMAACLASHAQKESLASPDGKYHFQFELKAGELSYAVTYDGTAVVEQGQLGVNIDNHLVELAMGIPVDTNRVWTRGMEIASVDRQTADSVWTPVYGEYDRIRDHYNEMTIHMVKGGKHNSQADGYDKRQQYLFDLIVRAYDEGVAFRYHFPEATNGLFMHITDDLTSFRFPAGTTAYHYAWAQATASHVPLLTSDPAWKEEAERPLTLRLPDGMYAAVGEADLSDFVRGKLKLTADNNLKMSMYGQADIITPYDMPWRFIMAGRRAVDLINNKQLVLNLNAPCRLTDTSWIRPGKAFRVCRLDMKSCLEGVNFCVDRGLQFIELDAGWYGTEWKQTSSALKVSENRDIDMPRLCRYAKDRGIGVWLYVNQHNPRRSFTCWVAAVADADSTFKGAVQPLCIVLPKDIAGISHSE